MIAARGALLLVAALVFVVAFGAAAAGSQPSFVRLTVTASVALLAPLFWPGAAATPRGNAQRVVGWSALACASAVLLMLALPGTRQPLPGVLRSAAMLAVILLASHAVVALLEQRLSRRCGDAAAREMAGRTVALALLMLGSMPLWLGPGGELLSAQHGGAIDAMLYSSPLVHLAVAAGNDLLRNAWLYQHSNLAGLQFDYPQLASLAWFYAPLCSLLGLLAVRARGAAGTHLPMEKTR